jgi:glucose-6-phosphate isomerase
VVPYSQDLSLFPAYLQQLYMESLGKSMSREGAALPFKTSEIIWGSAGTNGQHSYFQQLHQGTEFTPVEFIACATASVDGGDERHRQLLANCLSQSMALMNGDETSADVGADNWEPQKTIAGNRPSTTLLLKQLPPHNLGALIALYEHKVFALSVLWNINAFDQWGVELGKRLSKEVYAALSESAGSLINQENIEAAASVESASTLDASTRALVQKISSWNTPR